MSNTKWWRNCSAKWAHVQHTFGTARRKLLQKYEIHRQITKISLKHRNNIQHSNFLLINTVRSILSQITKIQCQRQWSRWKDWNFWENEAAGVRETHTTYRTWNFERIDNDTNTLSTIPNQLAWIFKERGAKRTRRKENESTLYSYCVIPTHWYLFILPSHHQPYIVLFLVFDQAVVEVFFLVNFIVT